MPAGASKACAQTHLASSFERSDLPEVAFQFAALRAYPEATMVDICPTSWALRGQGT